MLAEDICPREEASRQTQTLAGWESGTQQEAWVCGHHAVHRGHSDLPELPFLRRTA